MTQNDSPTFREDILRIATNWIMGKSYMVNHVASQDFFEDVKLLEKLYTAFDVYGKGGRK